MIYLDNSASTFFKPAPVINAVTNAMTYFSANPGRSGHSAALRAARLVYAAREKCAALIGADSSQNIIFTNNCSAALNLAILGSVKKHGHIVTTVYEHNSVLRPLYELKRRGYITLSVAFPDGDGAIRASAVEKLIERDTYMVITNHVSNVSGAIAPVDEIGKLCRNRGILYLTDCAQSAGYVDIDMKRMNIDMLCFAPHKGLHAPQGVGVLAVNERVKLKPIIFGGTGTASALLIQPDDMPDGFETGTLPTPAIAGLCAAISYAEKHKIAHRKKISDLSAKLRRGLSEIEGVKIYSPLNALSGIISFNITGMDSETVGDILNSEYDVCVRAGLHCAPLAHEYLGTKHVGTVRASLGYDNTEDEINFFLKAVREIADRR